MLSLSGLKMPTEHICGVPGCNNRGTITLPSSEPRREQWYQILQLSRNSSSHRICVEHFDGRDFGISGQKLRRNGNILPSRNLPLNSVGVHTGPKLNFLSLNYFFFPLTQNLDFHAKNIFSFSS